jgi:predicted porin
MNKKLIAIAIAGALAAPLAAQAEVSIYGTMDVSVESFNNDNAAAAEDSSLAASSNSSNIGFKGAEDLGGGMKAIWQAEAGVNVTDANGGGNGWAARNTIVGLAGGFGTVVVGRHDTPYKIVGRKVDFFVNGVGDTRTLTNTDGQDARTNNVIAYISPNMNGLSLFAAYVTDVAGDGTDDTNNDAYSFSVSYANGPLYVAVANQKISADALGATDDAEATRLVASYKLGALKVAGSWQQDKAVGGTDGADRDGWGLGAAYTMGNNTLKAQYYNLGELDNVDKTGASKWAIGVDHAMSKQTTLYAAYAAVSNDDASAINVTGNGDGHGDSGPAGATELGGSPSAFSVGIKHKF